MRIILSISFALMGCASVPPLTEGGKSVRIVTTTPHNCKYVSQIEGKPGSGMVNDFDQGNVNEMLNNDIKNRAYELGANTVEVTRRDNLRWFGESYKCDYSK